MQFFTDYTAVRFTGIDHIFDVYSTFCEFSLFGKEFSIKFYGVIIAFGFLLAVLFGGRMAYKWKLDLNKMLDILLFGTIGGILGARLYYVLFEWEYYRVHLAEIPQIWHGGLAIYGGLIGGILAAYFTCRHNGLNFLKLLDLAGMSFLIGQGIGRWGNYANQEAFGTNTEGFLGMSSAKVTDYIYAHESEFLAKGISMDPSLPVHPTFLYESIWCLLGFLVLAAFYKKRRFNGQIFLSYIIWYGLGRAWIEGLRTDSLLIGSTGLRASQLVAIGSVIVAAVLMVIGLRSAKGKQLMVTLAVKDIKKQAEAGDRFAPDTLPANAPHAEFVKATDAMNDRLAALDLNAVEIEEIEEPKAD